MLSRVLFFAEDMKGSDDENEWLWMILHGGSLVHASAGYISKLTFGALFARFLLFTGPYRV